MVQLLLGHLYEIEEIDRFVYYLRILQNLHTFCGSPKVIDNVKSNRSCTSYPSPPVTLFLIIVPCQIFPTTLSMLIHRCFSHEMHG